MNAHRHLAPKLYQGKDVRGMSSIPLTIIPLTIRPALLLRSVA
jgi:hypothetical protein